MDPEQTIRRSIWKFPRISPNRAAVLHHLFYVIGNGYSWENGELVSYSDYEDYSDDRAYVHCKRHSDGSCPDWCGDWIKEWNAEVDRVRREINVRCKELRWTYPLKSLYPRCPDYAHIFNIPADCTPEWLAAAYEAASYFEPLYALDSV